MDKEIKKILEDIYSIDKSLKANEAQLVKIIQQLLISKPEAKIDKNFISQLRLKLIAEGRLLPATLSKTGFSFSLSQKLALVASGALIILLAVFIGVKENRDNPLIPTGNNQFSAKDAGENAFGKIVFSSQDQINQLNQEAAIGSESYSQSPMTALGLGAGGDNKTSLIYPAPPYEYSQYKFVYKGGSFDTGGAKQKVYRRITDSALGSDLANVISKMDLGTMNLASFKNMKVNSLEISEDREFGYSLYIDFRQNTFSISMNWEKWPILDYNSNPVARPSDQEIIAIADRFLTDYGIDKQKYGNGEVIDWGWIGIMKEGSGIAVPSSESVAPDSVGAESASMPIRYTENVSVVYPLMIDGIMVFDQSGQKYGINVSVDLRQKKVAGVYNINISGFETSLYETETDVNKIIKFAEASGLYGNYGYYYDYPEGAKIVDVELGTPKKELVIIWQYEERKGTGRELFVPSLLFPIVSDSAQTGFYYGYGNYIIVPLVGELMENQNGAPRPLPLETRPAL